MKAHEVVISDPRGDSEQTPPKKNKRSPERGDGANDELNLSMASGKSKHRRKGSDLGNTLPPMS